MSTTPTRSTITSIHWFTSRPLLALWSLIFSGANTTPSSGFHCFTASAMRACPPARRWVLRSRAWRLHCVGGRAALSRACRPMLATSLGRRISIFLAKVYSWFYFAANLGHFSPNSHDPLAPSKVWPWSACDAAGPQVAFAIPGVLMGIAAIVFFGWGERNTSMHRRPGGPRCRRISPGITSKSCSSSLFYSCWSRHFIRCTTNNT